MNANLKTFVGAAVAALAFAMVACGKSGGSGSNSGVNCIQVGATCVATAPGYISSGTWRGNLYNGSVGSASVTIRLTPNGAYGGGFGGGYGGAYGYPGYGSTVGVGAVQTMAQVTIRTATGVLSGTGIAQGSVGGFNVSFIASTPYGQQQVNVAGQFVDGTQRAMNVQTSGAISVGGMITGNPDNQGLGGVGYGGVGGGYGYGGGNYGGGYGYGYPVGGQVIVPIDPYY